jgi:CubicO group peptidase (beta-lactamase class C family)
MNGGAVTRHVPTKTALATGILLLVSWIVPAGLTAQDVNAGKVAALFKAYDRRDAPGASVVVISKGRVVYEGGFGSADLEHGIPINATTVFHVGSVSKQFTAFAILLLEQQGRLSLDDDIRKHLPDVPDFGPTITLRHLLHHQSGMREHETLLQMSGISTADVIETVHILKLVGRQKELDFNPGEDISYSNTGYVLLAQVVEKVTGMSFRQWTRENIFVPLSMKDSQFNDSAARVVKDRACPYYTDERGEILKGILSYFFVGSTGLLTTAEDMGKWLGNFDQPKVGSQAIVQKVLFESAKLKSGEDPGYGYGIGVVRYRNLRAVWHSGHDAGYRAFVAYFPDERFGVAVLSNFLSIDPSNLGKKIADIYLADAMSPDVVEPAAPAKDAEESKTNAPFPVATQRLGELAGNYWSEELETTYHLLSVNGRLVIRHWRNEDVVLTPTGQDLFEGNQDWVTGVRFLRDGKGTVTGFRLTGGRVRSLLFKRMG